MKLSVEEWIEKNCFFVLRNYARFIWASVGLTDGVCDAVPVGVWRGGRVAPLWMDEKGREYYGRQGGG